MARVKFIDVYTGPESLGEYEWNVGHSEENASGATVNVQRTAPTGGAGAGFVRQIGDPQPFTRALKGTILDRVQFQKMWAYFFVCGGLNGPERTIHFVDQLSARFEVLFTDFRPVTVRGQNRRGTTDDEKMVYWTYDLTLEVVNVISGWP